MLQARNNKAVQEAEGELRGDMVWAGIILAVAQLRDEDIDWLLDLPTFLKLPGVIVGHAALHDVENWLYLVDDADIIATLDELAVRELSLGFFGHSHDQQWFTTSPNPVVETMSAIKACGLPWRSALAMECPAHDHQFDILPPACPSNPTSSLTSAPCW